MKGKIYISGKITGLEITEAEANFQNYEDLLSMHHFEPVNPMKLNHQHDKSWESYMREDLIAMLQCDGVLMLDGWEDSRGAVIERKLALSIGIKVYHEFKDLF